MSLKLKTFITLLIGFAFYTKAQNITAKEDRTKFPQPGGIKNLLFYVQRTLNTNTIIYELNTNETGELDFKEPIKFYYINYAHHGEVEAVSDIQKKYAYGIEIKLISKEKLSYSFSFNSFKNRPLYLIQSEKDKKFHVFCYINKQLAILNNVFITMENNFVGFPIVKKIELLGIDVAGNEQLVETFIP